MPKQKITANQFLAKIGSSVINIGTSWDGYDKFRDIIVMKLWKNERQREASGKIRILLWKPHDPESSRTSKVGRNERNRSIRAITDGKQVFALMRDGGGNDRPGGNFYDIEYLYEISSIETLENGVIAGVVGRTLDINQFLRELPDIQMDLNEIDLRYEGSPTTRKAMIDARLGQGRFRSNLLALWNERCAVTGSTVLQAIRASHAKPWKSSSDHERLDPNNGLPLIATLDALFDAGLIGFDSKKGSMLVSKIIPLEAYGDLGIPKDLSRAPTEIQSKYLLEHLNSVFKKG